MEQELQKPGKLVARGPAEAVEVTSEPSVEIEYRLEPEANGWVPTASPRCGSKPASSCKPMPRKGGGSSTCRHVGR